MSTQVVFPGSSWPCDLCGERIKPGDVAVLDEVALAHERCPVRWTPTVIDGERKDDDASQLTLDLRPALRVVEGTGS